MRLLVGFMLASGLAMTAGCVSKEGPELALRARQVRPVLVQVSNHNWMDVNVFAVRGERRVRLGMVTSMTSKVLQVPNTLLNGSSNLRFVADPIGSQSDYSSEFMSVWPGQTMDFAVENQLSMSRVVLTSN